MAQELRPKGPFGVPLYRLLKDKPRADQTRWNAQDLAAALHKLGMDVTPKTIREWIKGETLPRADMLMAIAEIFGVSPGELWQRPAKGINLPQDHQKRAGGVPAAVPSQSDVERHLKAVRPKLPAKSRRRKSG